MCLDHTPFSIFVSGGQAVFMTLVTERVMMMEDIVRLVTEKVMMMEDIVRLVTERVMMMEDIVRLVTERVMMMEDIVRLASPCYWLSMFSYLVSFASQK